MFSNPWTVSSFADTKHNAESGVFYKIEVEMEP
jgi:hypothetical protein